MADKEKMPVMVVGGLVVVVLAAVLITIIVMMRKINKAITPAPPPWAQTEGWNQMGPTQELGEFIVNLSDPGHYVKANLTLELNAPGKNFEGGVEKEGEKKDTKKGDDTKEVKEYKSRLAEEIKVRDPQIREAVNRLLGSFKSTQLIGSQGIERAKKLLTRGVQYMLAGGELKIKDDGGTPKVDEDPSVVDRMEKEGVKIKNVFVTVLQVE